MKEVKSVWELTQFIYKTRYGIPYKVLNYIAVFQILNLCAMGYSTKRISLRLGLNLTYITSILQEYLFFEGWNIDLDFSPLAIYKRCNGNYSCFYYNIIGFYTCFDASAIGFSYRICTVVDIIRKEIDKYYE